MFTIGITGTHGAGKGEVVNYLINHKAFSHYSVRGFLIEEIKRRNLEVDRNSMRLVANDLRANNHPGFIIEELYKVASEDGSNSVIESIRAHGEIEFLKSKGDFYLVAVDANRETRYERVCGRGSETDKVTFEEFIEQEDKEMNATDPNKQNLSECIKRADYVIKNEGSLEELYRSIEEMISKIEHPDLA